MILATSNILLTEAFSKQIIPVELWNKIANGKQHFSVLFVKRTTDELRNITHATMNVDMMLKRTQSRGGKKYDLSDQDLLFIRDDSQLDNNGIQGAARSIPIENIIQIKCGQIYDFKKVNNIPYFYPEFKNSTLAKSDTDNIILVENNVEKFKEVLRSGMVTKEVVNALLDSDSIDANDKPEIKKLAIENGIIMEKINIKTLVENVVRGLITENEIPKINTDFIQQYIKIFAGLQRKYNTFFNSQTLSYPNFYNVMAETDEANRNYDLIKHKTLNSIWALPEYAYDQNDDHFVQVENIISDLSKKIDLFTNEVEKAGIALKNLDDVEYTLNLF